MLAQGAAEVTLLESLLFEGPNAYIPERNNPDPVSWRRGHLIFCAADFCCVWNKAAGRRVSQREGLVSLRPLLCQRW